MIELEENNKRLRSEMLKKDGALLDASTAYKEMIRLLESDKKLLEEQIELTKLQRPTGRTANMSLTLPVGSKLAHIDFISGLKGNMSVLPTGSNLEFPFGKLYSLKITNYGPATVVYSTNEPRNSSEADIPILANETEDLGMWPFPTFETLNIALAAGSTDLAQVRIRGLA